MRGFNHCWFLLLLVFSSNVFALQSWEPYWAGSNNIHYVDADAACRGNYGSTYYAASGGPNAKGCYKTGVSGSYIGMVSKVTPLCPDGSPYSSTGTCNEPVNPCQIKTGTSDRFTKSGTSGDGYGSMSGGFGAAAQSGCFGGCAASTADQKCTFKVSGEYTCRGNSYFSGAQCSTSPAPDVDSDPDPQSTPPEPQDYNDSTPCIYSADGSGAQVCSSSSTSGKEGQYCGTYNGVEKCVSSKPTEKGTVVDTTVTSTQNPDGSTTTTKKDTATTTTCSGIGACSSSSTTTTTSTTKDANGTTTGVSGSCTGAQCPDKNTNPDGDGDGLGDCVGECGEGEGGAADWYEPGEDTYQSVMESYADRMAAAPVLGSVTNFLTFTPSGACPVYTVDTWVFSIRLDQWCEGSNIPWELIKAVILACCAFFAFRIAFL